MIKTYEITSNGIGPLMLGMSKDDVRNEMKDESEMTSLERGTIPSHFPESDIFFDGALVVEYTDKGLVDTITILRGIGSVTPSFKKIDLFANIASDAITLFTDAFGEGQKKEYAIEVCYSWPANNLTLQVINDSDLVESVTISSHGGGCVVSPINYRMPQ